MRYDAAREAHRRRIEELVIDVERRLVRAFAVVLHGISV
jgi:hypothetical protein